MATPTANSKPQNYFSTTLSGTISGTDTTIHVNAVPTATEGWLEIDGPTPALREIIFFNSTGSNFVTCPDVPTGRGQGGTSAVGHASSAPVAQKLNAEWYLALQNGNSMGLNSIQAQHLATSAITLGYAQITGNINTTSTSPVQATGLTATVTIPAGGRRVKVTVYILSFSNGTGSNGSGMQLWSGTVGSGTQLQQLNAIPNNNLFACMIFVHTPSAGSFTYNVGYQSITSGTTTIAATANGPAFILVEAI